MNKLIKWIKDKFEFYKLRKALEEAHMLVNKKYQELIKADIIMTKIIDNLFSGGTDNKCPNCNEESEE